MKRTHRLQFYDLFFSIQYDVAIGLDLLKFFFVKTFLRFDLFQNEFLEVTLKKKLLENFSTVTMQLCIFQIIPHQGSK